MKQLIGFTILILIVGMFSGILLGGFNPWKNPAEADMLYVKAEHERKMNELEYQKSAAQTQAEIQKIQQEQALLEAQNQHDIQAMSQDLEHRDLAFKTLMNILSWIGGALSIALILWVGSKALVAIWSISQKEKPMKSYAPLITKVIPNVSERKPYEPLEMPYKKLYNKRIQERMDEIMTDKDILIARMKAITNPTNISTYEYKNKPLAG